MYLIIFIILIFIILFESHPMFNEARILLIDYLMSYRKETTCISQKTCQPVKYDLPVMFKGPGIPFILLIDDKLRKVSYCLDNLILDYYIDDKIYMIERKRSETKIKIYPCYLLTGLKYCFTRDNLVYCNYHPSDLLVTYPKVIERVK